MTTPKERPAVLHGITERVRTGHGNLYVTVNSDGEGQPFEVFATLGKAGGDDSAYLEAVARLVSMALRSGVEPKSIVDQLRGITCAHNHYSDGVQIASVPDAVAIAIDSVLKRSACG